MKLHLPTALRRALLAITALLSPAVVTTTLATATLASFSATAMAEDYYLLPEFTDLGKDEEYESVKVTQDAHISANYYPFIGGSHELTFTAKDTLTVNSGCRLALTSDFEKVDKVTLHTETLTVNGTIEATYIEHFVLDATTINVGENGAINIGMDAIGGLPVHQVTLNVGSLNVGKGARIYINTDYLADNNNIITCKIGGKITNNGTIDFNDSKATINIVSSGFQAEYSYSDVKNGYKVASIYTVLTGTGTITGIDNCTWQVDSATASYANGKVTVSGLDTSVFYVKNGVVKYGKAEQPLFSTSTKFSLEGGSLKLGKELINHQGIIAKTAGSSVEILSGTELKSNQVTVEGSGSVVLSGGGSYTMANGTNTLGTGVSVGKDWTGTVNTTGNTTALELDTLGVSGSHVVLGSNNHTLAARDQSVAANLNSTGSISLTGNKLTLSGTNELGSLNVGSLEIAGGSTTITNGLTTGRESSVATGATLNIKGNSTLGGKITNNGTLNLSGTINVDSTALTAETSERYSGGDNGYKTVDTIYTVLTGNAATGTATWKVGTDSATYEDGKVIVAGIEDKSVYYVRNNIVNYGTVVTVLETEDTKFSLEGGSLELGKELVNGQGIVAKTADSSVKILSNTTLKSNQVTVEGSGSVVLSGGGAYEITGTELSLGSGVSVGSDWSGTVKTVGDTTVSSNLDTTSWKNTELNGTTTVNSGVTLTLGDTTTLKGKITNSGTLNLGDNITIDYSSFAAAGDARTINPHYQQGSSAESMTSGFISSSAGMTIQVVEGYAANATGAIWSVTGVNDGSYTFDEATGKLHVVCTDSVRTEFYINNEDTITYDQNAAMFKNINGKDATGLVLNGGNLVLSTDLLNDTMEIVAYKAGSVEIGNGVTLNASQLNVESAPVTLSGKGTYILKDGITTLDANVNLGSDWSGTLQTTGDTSDMNLEDLAQGSPSLDLGDADHSLADRNQSVAANLNSDGSISLTGKKLTLSGTNNTLGSLNVGSLEIAGGSTTVDKGLTTDGAITNNGELTLSGTNRLNGAITNTGELNLSGTSTLGGTITNSGELNLSGNITILRDDFDGVVTTINPHYQQGSSAESMTSGFISSSDGITIQVVDGNSANATGANWSVDGVTNGSYTFDEATGKLHVVCTDSVRTEFYINDEDTITYDKSAAMFENINGFHAEKLVLNGGSLVLSTNLPNDTMKIVAKTADSSVTILSGTELKSNHVTVEGSGSVVLSGGGSYTMANRDNTLGSGVSVGSGWSGTVKVSGGASALNISSLGASGSTIELGAGDYTLAAADNHTVNAKVYGEQSSLTMNGGALVLNDTTTLKGVYGASSITATGATISNGLTTDSISGTVSVTGGTVQETNAGSAISTSGIVELKDVTLGSVLNNRGTLSFAGNMTLDTNLLGNPTDTENWYSDSNGTDQSVGGWYGSTSGSGFRTIQDIYTVVTGTAADNTASWKVDNRVAEYADGKVLAFQEKNLSTYWVNTNSEVILGTADDAFTDATDTIALNGGKLVVDTNTDLILQSHVASAVDIADGYALNASQLNASAARVTLSGKGIYDMQGKDLDGTVQLATGVALDENAWEGTVYTGSTKRGAALDIRALGNSQSTVHLGARPIRRATPGETVLESLKAAGVGTTEIPGPLTLQNGSSTADTLVVNGILTLGSTNTAASLEAASVSLQGLNFAHADSCLDAGKLVLEGATKLDVQLTDDVLSNKESHDTLTLLTLDESFDVENIALTFNGSTETERVRSGDNRKEYTLAWDETGKELTLTILGTETYVTEQVAPTTHNGKAGVALMTEVFLNSRPQKDAPDGALAGILNAVDAGTATDRDMAAVAGASTAALGMALSGDVERQLSAIRNRSVAGNDAGTVTFASGKSGMLAAAPARFFAWVNAEGNRAEQDADSTAAGYTLTSWGGTLGAGMQVNDKLTLGLALTAMYGDLQSDGPDSLKGDMDTTYVSAFARYNRGKWSHAFIGTVGSMEADYKRTVSHAAGSYNASGDTDGTAFGLMYEVSRSMQLSNRSTLSPVFNISYRHTEVDSYSESGADAALNVGKQSLDTVTAGAGARYAAVVGQRMLNRACGFEARALVKYDLGDRQSTTSTGFINRATRAGIESAELGAFGVELGAGISVPVRTGSIFADGAVELRSDYTNFNATVGYKIQF